MLSFFKNLQFFGRIKSPGELSADDHYQRLESRCLLSATFATIGTSELVLSAFDAGQDLTVLQQSEIVNGTSQDAYVFRLAAGDWTGVSLDPLIEVENFGGGTNNQLEIATSFFTGGAAGSTLTINDTGSTPIQFEQASALLTFDTLNLSNIANDNLDFSLVADGDVNLDNVSVFDSNPNNGPAAASQLNVNIDGQLQLQGDVSNSVNATGGISLTATDDVQILGGSTLELTSTIDAAISIDSDQDVEIIDGSIETNGGGEHSVVIDTDGAVINAAGSSDSIATNRLIIDAGQGIGDRATPTNDQPLRTDIDSADLNVRNEGNIRILESDIIFVAQATTNNGFVQIEADGTIIANQITAGENELTEDNADTVSLQSNAGNILLDQVDAADGLVVRTVNGDITDRANANIRSGADANFDASGNINLGSTADRSLTVAGQTDFVASSVVVGRDGLNNSNVSLGTVGFVADQAFLAEDGPVEFGGTTNVDQLYVESPAGITNSPNASVSATSAQFDTPGTLTLGNQPFDLIQITNLGVTSTNAYLELDADVTLNGTSTTTVPQLVGATLQPSLLTTNVGETLYVTTSGSVEQYFGDLIANQIGIEATQHVHLANVAASNQSIGVTAGSAAPISSPLSTVLQSLAAAPNSEVDGGAEQAISIGHRGDINLQTVNSPVNGRSATGLNSADGSISAFADQAINISNDITATGPTADPQVTVWSAAGDANDPAINFVGGEIIVSGPTNDGIVNANQVFANFFDDDGFVFEGTTQVLTLNANGTADQNIVVEYGHSGEAGYRVGVVWDALNRFGNQLEDINLFVPDPTVQSEGFVDDIYVNGTVNRQPIGGNEGGSETLTKVEPFSREAIVSHINEPKVFSDVTVRNDQNINLFSGALSNVDNSLNETSQRLLQAEFDAPKRAQPILPTINPINPIEVKKVAYVPLRSSTPLEQSTNLFGRSIAPFENGELQWVQVSIPIEDLELVGEEVRLKQPTHFYAASEGSEEHDFENVGENEIERIVQQIEFSPDAEPGYWYRIFKAYDNRDDELFFYHYKTGETDSPADSPADSIDADDVEIDSLPAEPTANELLESNDDRLDTSSTSSDDQETAGIKVSSASILLLSLLKQKNGVQTSNQSIQANSNNSRDSPSDESSSVEMRFDRLARLKRQLKRRFSA